MKNVSYQFCFFCLLSTFHFSHHLCLHLFIFVLRPTKKTLNNEFCWNSKWLHVGQNFWWVHRVLYYKMHNLRLRHLQWKKIKKNTIKIGFSGGSCIKYNVPGKLLLSLIKAKSFCIYSIKNASNEEIVGLWLLPSRN